VRDKVPKQSQKEKMVNERKKLGNRGEKIAAKFLRKQGYRIIEKNYNSRLGEIDIVAKEDESIAFVEVKTRRSTDFGLPEEALSYDKRRRLSKLALGYLAHRRIKDTNCRFDVVSILMDTNKVRKVNHIKLIKNAFPAVY
jgi:putative endonuclease